MDIYVFFKKLDELYDTHREKVEAFLLESMKEARSVRDKEALITILNEAIGFYRDRDRMTDCILCCDAVKQLLLTVGEKDSKAYATTLLNVATAYRAFGRLIEAEKIYREVLEIYGKLLSPKDYLYAALYNNIALLKQKQKLTGESIYYLKKAIRIIEAYPEAKVELATSQINLAEALMKTENWRLAKPELLKAMKIYLEGRTDMFHYSFALSALARYLYLDKAFEEALAIMKMAMEHLEKKVGRTADYRLLKADLKLIEKAKRESNG